MECTDACKDFFRCVSWYIITMDVKDAMQSASIKLRQSLEVGNEVLAPNSSKEINADPVLSEYFNLEAPDEAMADKIDGIKSWFKEMGYEDDAIIPELRNMELRMGDNTNPNRLDRVAHYIELRIKSRIFSKKADAMMR